MIILRGTELTIGSGLVTIVCAVSAMECATVSHTPSDLPPSATLACVGTAVSDCRFSQPLNGLTSALCSVNYSESWR